MCTLILLHRCVDGAPLVAAANRDEYLDRPATRPALGWSHGVPLVAPRDLQAGGTWLGLSASGLFAAVTNRPIRTSDPARRSRGLLVIDALEAPDAAAAAERLESIPAGRYNPFNLVVADGRDAFVLVYEETGRIESLAPGVHVIGNADPNAPGVPKIARLRARAERLVQGPSEGLLDALAELCASHEGGGSPLDDTCIHTPRYGTRSSTLLRVGGPACDDTLRFADGPPCRTVYEDFTHLLGALDRAVDPGPGARAARTPS